MMENRLQLYIEMMSNGGVIFTNIDDNEVSNLTMLKKKIFGEEFVELYIWDVREDGTMPKTAKRTVRKEHEYIITAFKNEKNMNKYLSYKYIDKDWSNPDNDPRGPWMSANISRGSEEASGKSKSFTITNPEGIRFNRDWSISEDEYNKLLADNRIYFSDNGKGVPRKKIFQNELVESIQSSIFEKLRSSQFGSKEIKEILKASILQYPKPTELIKRLCQLGSSNQDIVIDFFAGSGTTAHAVLNLNKADRCNRKYILIEMGDYFDTIMKPRIQKIMFSKDWKDGKPQSKDGISHIFKYQYLEQYEDTLNNIEFKDAGSYQRTLSEMDGYFLRYMLDFETMDSSPCRFNVEKLTKPFDYTLRITHGNELKDEKVDLVETFNYLLGIHVRQIKTFSGSGTYYKVVLGRKNEDEIAIIWRDTENIDLKADKAFIEGTILSIKPSKTYINADFYVEGALPIEPEFKKLMVV